MNQKWLVETSGFFDYIKIVKQLDNEVVEYFNTTEENYQKVKKLAIDIAEKHNDIIGLLKT